LATYLLQKVSKLLDKVKRDGRRLSLSTMQQDIWKCASVRRASGTHWR